MSVNLDKFETYIFPDGMIINFKSLPMFDNYSEPGDQEAIDNWHKYEVTGKCTKEGLEEINKILESL